MAFNGADANSSFSAPQEYPSGFQVFPQKPAHFQEVVWAPLPLPSTFEPDDETDRTFKIDQEALANLRPFDTEPLSRALDTCGSASPRFRSPLTALSAISEGRRHSVASLISPNEVHDGGYAPVSPPDSLRFRRRRSTPIATPWPRSSLHRRDSRSPGHFCVVPRQLERPRFPLTHSSGKEIWWPALPNGDLRVFVVVTSRTGQPEKFTKYVPVGELQYPVSGNAAATPSPRAEPFSDIWAPGTVLPVPGSVPQIQSAALAFGRRSSTGDYLGPKHSRLTPSRRRGSQFAGEFLDKDDAIKFLPVVGSILIQTKRPVQWYEAIHVPLPYPSAWPDTVEYVSTNDRQLLSESVKWNLLHLGGRP